MCDGKRNYENYRENYGNIILLWCQLLNFVETAGLVEFAEQGLRRL